MSIDAEAAGSGVSKLEGEDAKPGTPSASRALARLMEENRAEEARRGFSIRPSQGVMAAGVALVLGAVFIGGAQFLGGKPQPAAALVAQAAPVVDPTAQMLRKLEDEIHTLKVGIDASRAASDNTRQDEAIRGLKRSVEALKQDLESAKSGSSTAMAQLGGKIDKLDKVDKSDKLDRDPGPKLAEISARLDKLDRNDKEPNAKLAEIAQRLDQLKTEAGKDKLAEITARLERIERSVASAAPTGSVAPPARTASAPPLPPAAPLPASRSASAAPPPAPAPAPDPKPPAKTATLDGWMLRDVYDGVALVEARSGGLREVAPGQTLPGGGEVRSIERRGRAWVVVTSRGVIEADNRW